MTSRPAASQLPGFVVVALALLLIVAAPLFVFGVYMPGFVTSDGALDRSLCKRSELPLVAPPGQVTLLIVDGLGFAYAMEFPELAQLREQAAMRPLAVEFPSFTTPALLSFATGVGPRESGVRLNAPTREVTRNLDNLRASADSAGRPIDFFDGGWKPFRQILFTDGATLFKGRRARDTSPFVSRKPQSIRVVYFGDVDTAGHEHGEKSEPFRLATVRAARFIERHVAAMDPGDRLLVASDHGHLAEGGHGGVEPEIMRATFMLFGQDARRGEVLALRPLDDVASTITSLAGIPTPACNRGQPMLDMLTLPAASSNALGAHARDQQERLAARVTAEPDTRRPWRMLFAATVTAVFAWLTRRRWPPRKAWLSSALLIVTYAAYLFARGYRLSFSMMPPQSDFIADAVVGGVLGVVLAVVCTARLALLENDGRATAFAILAGATWPMFWMASWVGIDPHVVPTPHVGLAVILWSPILIAAGLASIALVIAPKLVRKRSQ